MLELAWWWAVALGAAGGIAGATATLTAVIAGLILGKRALAARGRES